MPVAHRKSVESRAQKRTNVGGVRPDGCGVHHYPHRKIKRPQDRGLWLRTSVFDLPASSGYA